VDENAPSIAVLAMIKSKKGVNNARTTLSTKGMAGIFVEPMDWRTFVRLDGSDGDEVMYLDALKIRVFARDWKFQ